MASYTKQMMEVAASWLAANPDPASPFLRLPGWDEEQKRDAAHKATVADLRARLGAIDRSDPRAASLFADIETLERFVAESEVLTAELSESYDRINNMLNASLEAGQGKVTVDPEAPNVRYPDLGRWALSWARQGYNVFDLSQDFTAAMLLTDPSALDIAAVRLPFQGFLLTIPPGFAVGSEGLHYTKVHVWETPKRHNKLLKAAEKIEEAIHGLPAAEQFEILNDLRAGHVPSTSLLGADKLISSAEANEADPPFLCFHATDGVHTLATYVEAKDLSWKVVEALPDDELDDKDRAAKHTIQQLVFGLLAYLSAVPEAATPREVKRKAKRPGTVEDSPKYWEVGRTVKIDPQLVRAARAGSREISFRIKNRFIVRGHYTNQPYGPGRSLRKRIYIEPFWKGPEEGAQIVHTYQPKPSEGTDG